MGAFSRSPALTLFSSLLLLVAAIACGSGGGASDKGGFQKVQDSARVYSIDNFLSIGFKQVKGYNVEGLPGATGASYGFWQVEGQDARNYNYELRFYGSHEDAVQQGTQLAEEVTGTDAVLITGKMTWKEGAKDRRVQSGRIGYLVPVYGDYAIIGNVVMLCEGLDSAQSLERCTELIAALAAQVE